MKNSWYEVDKKGLAKILARRNKTFIVYEMVQNAWDQDITEINITLEPISHRRAYKLTVIDDDPQGFLDLSHAFTLYAESNKKSNPLQRGRFNLGEKLVLACCEEAKVITTTGGVIFTKNGIRKAIRQKTETGSVFEATLKMTKREYDHVCQSVELLIPPQSIKTYFNGKQVEYKNPINTFQCTLPTEVSNSEGLLKRTQRKTAIEVYEVSNGEKAHLYEMGIPVVVTGDTYHVNIMQKVPLNMDRDNVTPSYLEKIRVAVLSNVHESLDEDTANELWVKAAVSNPQCDRKAVKQVMDVRFGKNRVAYDPSDTESNKRAVSEGYTVIHGRQLSKGEWANVKKTRTVTPAGQIFPSPKPESSQDGKPPIDPSKYTDSQKMVVQFTELLAEKLMGIDIIVNLYRILNRFEAWYGNHEFSYNLSRLGNKFFNDFPHNLDKVLSLILHEFGHEYSDDHLSGDYYRALTDLGAKLTKLALNEPECFDIDHIKDLTNDM